MTTEVKDVVARLREKVEQGHSLAAFMAERQLEGAETIEALARVVGEAASLLDEVLSVLQSPEALHANMLRGGVAKLSIRQALHLHGAGALEKWDNADAAESRATAAEGRVALLEEALTLCAGVLPLFIEPSQFGTSVQSAWAQAVAAEVAARQALGLPMKADAE